jgi:hypothetical protein
LRKLWLVPAIGLVLLLVLLLLQRPTFRGGEGHRGEEGSSFPLRAERDATAAEQGAAGEEGDATEGTARPGTSDLPPIDGRLAYGDGTPAASVLLHLAAGRPVDVRVFRNGEHTDKTVYLVTGHAETSTGADGSFRFPAVPGCSRCRTFVYTADDSQALVVAEVLGAGETILAQRCVRTKGRLVDRDGKPLGDYWLEGRCGKPEDWQTRVLYEEDSFVGRDGDLGVDTLAVDDAHTDPDGSFSLVLAEGRNTLVFGETRADGSIGVDVKATGPDLTVVERPPAPSRRAAMRRELSAPDRRAAGAMDLGELRVPGATLLAEPHDLRGQVLTLAGTPHAGCPVLAWDGSVGAPTHEATTDEQGAFTVEGLTSPNVILWAVPTERRHIDLPVQTSATIRMPCVSPIVLQAPTEEEYVWARIEIPGYYLFVRKDVFAAGESLDRTDVVGLPPGPLHIYLVTDRILEATLDLREPGEILLPASRFRDTTWD